MRRSKGCDLDSSATASSDHLELLADRVCVRPDQARGGSLTWLALPAHFLVRRRVRQLARNGEPGASIGLLGEA